MTAMTQERNTPRRDSIKFDFPAAASVRVFNGAIVAINAAGYAESGKTATGLQGLGIAQETTDNRDGANGACFVAVRRGCFMVKNSGTDPITLADAGKTCFIVDDQTVAKTDGAGTRSPAGVVRDVVSGGVWVEF